MSWSEYKIADIATLVTKGTTPTTYGMSFKSEGVNFVKAEALNGDTSLDRSGFTFIDDDTHQKLKRSQLQKSDVLITIAGANIGKCGFVRGKDLPANTNQAVGIIRVDERKINPKFLYYYFKNPHTFNICQGLSGQAAQPNINLTTLKNIKFKAPDSRLEQNKIESVITRYDNLIENNNRRIQLLEESARLLYQEWFVRLRFPNYEKVKVVDGVPEGWESQSIAQLANTVGGGTPSTKVDEYWNDGDIPWFSPTDLTRNDCLVLLDSEKRITSLGLQKSSAKLLPAKSILMSSRASIGFFGVFDQEACTNQGFISLIPNNENHRWYLLYNLMSRKKEIVSLSKGTTFKEISKTTFRAINLLVPPEILINQFNKYSETIYQSVKNLKKQNQKLTQSRDLLLPRLMNGDIKV